MTRHSRLTPPVAPAKLSISPSSEKPLPSLVLAVVWLGERAGAIEWVSIALSFVGVLLVVQPGATLDAGLLWALGAGVCYGALMLAPFAVAELDVGAVERPAWLLAMALSSVTANLLALMAYARAGAAWLAPVVYVQLVAATVLGLVFFGDRVGTVTAAGLALILLTGVLRLPIMRRAGARTARAQVDGR